mmetsp:Transcript_49462/g.132353  ORF Transcript_49462/g.132353 Transcript_49462/m.132353 type:complete len:646 (+) Transcript_49462:92-2029(+)
MAQACTFSVASSKAPPKPGMSPPFAGELVRLGCSVSGSQVGGVRGETVGRASMVKLPLWSLPSAFATAPPFMGSAPSCTAPAEIDTALDFKSPSPFSQVETRFLICDHSPRKSTTSSAMVLTVRCQLSASRRHSDTATMASRTAPIMASVAAAVAVTTVAWVSVPAALTTATCVALSALTMLPSHTAGSPAGELTLTPDRSASSAKALHMAANWLWTSISASEEGVATPPPHCSDTIDCWATFPSAASGAPSAAPRARQRSRARPSASTVTSWRDDGTARVVGTALSPSLRLFFSMASMRRMRSAGARRSSTSRRLLSSSPAFGASSRLRNRLTRTSICSGRPTRSSSPTRCASCPICCTSTACRRPWSSTACRVRSRSPSLPDKPLTSSRKQHCLCSMASSLMFVVSCTTTRVSDMDLLFVDSAANASSLAVASATRSSNSLTTKPISSAPSPRVSLQACSAMSCTSSRLNGGCDHGPEPPRSPRERRSSRRHRMSEDASSMAALLRVARSMSSSRPLLCTSREPFRPATPETASDSEASLSRRSSDRKASATAASSSRPDSAWTALSSCRSSKATELRSSCVGAKSALRENASCTSLRSSCFIRPATSARSVCVTISCVFAAVPFSKLESLVSRSASKDFRHL